MTTTDAAGRSGNVTLSADGDINLTSTTAKITKTFDFASVDFENNYSAGHYSGEIIKYDRLSDTSLTAGQIYYLRPSNGSWVQADADAASSSQNLLGVGLGGGSRAVGVLLRGFISIPASEILNTPSDTPGLPIYISTTLGHFDFTAPSGSGDIVRIVGHAIDDNSGNILIYFNPDSTYIEIA